MTNNPKNQIQLPTANSELLVHKPFVARDLISLDVEIKGQSASFVVDPGTQHWIVCTKDVAEILSLMDGQKTILDLASACLQQGQSKKDVSWWTMVCSALRKQGLLFGSTQEHRDASNEIVNKTDIYGIHFEITNACNLRCTHCYLSSASAKPNELSFEQIKHVVDQLPAHANNKICITGGEPLMRKDIVDILRYTACDRGLITDLYTNALLIDETFIGHLKNINQQAKHSINIQISLEGSDEASNDAIRGKGTFRKILGAIELLNKHGLSHNVVLFVCLSKNNISQVLNIYEMAKRLNVGLLNFSQWQKQGRAIDTNWEDKTPSTKDWVHWGEWLLDRSHSKETPIVRGNFFADLKNTSDSRYSLDSLFFPKFKCGLNYAPRIDCQGNTWPCQIFVDSESMVGNIKNNSLGAMFDGPSYALLLKKCQDRSTSVSECQSCLWKPICAGGCPAFAKTEWNTFHRKDCFCAVRKHWFAQYVKHQIEKLHGSISSDI